MAVNRMFRTCPSTGLVYHEPAEKLMRWNAVAGVANGMTGLAPSGSITEVPPVDTNSVHFVPSHCWNLTAPPPS